MSKEMYILVPLGVLLGVEVLNLDYIQTLDTPVLLGVIAGLLIALGVMFKNTIGILDIIVAPVLGIWLVINGVGWLLEWVTANVTPIR